jgi:type I restriction enzyme S subunit
MDLTQLVLPNDWSLKPISDAYTFTKRPRGLTVLDEDVVPFLPMDAIPIGHARVSAYVERRGASLSSGTYIENGDLLVAKITPSFENGKQAIVDWKQPFGFATTEVIPLQGIPGVGDKFYLFHLLLHPAIRSDLAGKMDGTTGRQRLSKEVLGSCVIPLPPVGEQRQIARVMGLVQQAMEQQEQLLAYTIELRRAVLHELFTRGLRGETQKETDIGPMPKSWDLVELGQLSHKPQYGFTESAKPSGSVQFLRITDIQDDGVQWSSVPFCECPADLIGKYLIADNDLLFARIGATTGKNFLVRTPPPAVFASYLIRVRLKDTTSADFVSQFCDTRAYWRQVEANKGNNLKGGINSSTLKRLLVPVPRSKEEQAEIAEIVRRIDLRAGFVRRKHRALSDLSRTLLHRLVTAQIRVNDIASPSLATEAAK